MQEAAELELERSGMQMDSSLQTRTSQILTALSA
jgi:hypothetical protein